MTFQNVTESRTIENAENAMSDISLEEKTVQNGNASELDIFGNQIPAPECQFCGKSFPKNERPNKKYCDNSCRANAYREAEGRKTEQRKNARALSACDFAEHNSDIVLKIAEWIKDDISKGFRSTFRYYWENFRRYRWQIGQPVQLNDHFEPTIKKLILNRFPELEAVIRMRTK
jgi:hypothetical protein